MKKCLMVTLCMIALAGTSIASAENAGIGFEWNIGPQFPLVPYFTSVVGFNNNFVLSWPVGDMTVGIFGETVRTRGIRSYSVTDEQIGFPAGPFGPAETTKYTIISNGSMTNSGMSLSTFLPGLDFLRLGIEIGTCTIASSHVGWENGTLKDPSVPADATDIANAWGSVGDINTMSPLAGLMMRWSLLSSKAKGIWTDIAVSANVRFVPIPDSYPLGTMEKHVANETGTPAPAPQSAGFDAMTSFNHANVYIGATIGF